MNRLVTQQSLEDLKFELLAVTSASLIREPKMTDSSSPQSEDSQTLRKIRVLVYSISLVDGEYALKLALYLRHELSLRTVSAVMMALCAREPNCQPFFFGYFERFLCLPSDWLAVANYSYFHDLDSMHTCDYLSAVDSQSELAGCTDTEESRKIPNTLRRALVKAFLKFDEFALAKYNNTRAVRRHSSSQTEFTFKRLIRLLHINDPPYIVCCILGKKYPTTTAEFNAMGLGADGKHKFDFEKAGTRMALECPLTWERAVSESGNKASVWDMLLEKKALPFMAMLRNLRNVMLRCGDQAIALVADRLTNSEEVAKSRQFPYRFFSARDAVMGTTEVLERRNSEMKKKALKPKTRRQLESMTVGSSTLSRFQRKLLSALDEAVCISSKLNVPPMAGASLIFFSLSHGLLSPMGGGGGKANQSKRTKLDAACVLLSMIYRSCESCKIVLVCLNTHAPFTPKEMHVSVLAFAEELSSACTAIINQHLNVLHFCGNSDEAQLLQREVGRFPFFYLDELVAERRVIESVVVFDEGHHTYSCMNADAPSLGDLPAYLTRLRRANPDLVFLGVNTGRASESTALAKARYKNRNDFLLSGFSDAILKFLAERSANSGTEVVERADVTYNVQRQPLSGAVSVGPLKKKAILSLLSQVEAAEKDAAPSWALAASSESIDDVVSGVEEPGTGWMECPETLPALPTRQLMERGSTAESKARPIPVSSLFNTHATISRRVLSSYRVWRYFISSTFLDMDGERNALVLDVFPRLRHWIAGCGLKVHLMEVDLRWGITEEASSTNLSTSVCLNEVARCSPFFIGMLGSRCGYVPSDFQVVADPDVTTQDFEWLKEPNLFEGCSVTELEIKQGIFSAKQRMSEGESAPKSVFLFQREELNAVVKDKEQSIYFRDASTQRRYDALTHYAKQEGVPVLAYRCPVRGHASNAAPYSSPVEDDVDGLPEVSALHGVLERTSLLPSQPVDLNMNYFSRTAFRAIQHSIAEVCGVTVHPVDGYHGAGMDGEEEMSVSSPRHTEPPSPQLKSTTVLSSEYYSRLYAENLAYSNALNDTYVSPRGFISSLVSFACSLGSSADSSHGVEDDRLRLVLAPDGDGKSSALAALLKCLNQLEFSQTITIYYSCQAAGASDVKAMLFFIATTLVIRADIPSVVIDERTDVKGLLEIFPRIARLLKKKLMSLTLVLDALDCSDNATETVSSFQSLYRSLLGMDFRFIVSAAPFSFFTQLMRDKLKSFGIYFKEVGVPELSEGERAEVVRRHLAVYGKRLQETEDMNEMSGLVKKHDAGKASYLTLALMHLRLFSTFEALRHDITQLPSTLDMLLPRFFYELERRFERETCSAVLVCLYLRHQSGGMMEYNLYRLMKNVASASRLVALLAGSCISSQDGLLCIHSSMFYNAIKTAYLNQVASVVHFSQRMLVAELLGAPMDTKMESSRTQSIIRSVTKEVELCTRSASALCTFNPARFAPHELFGILLASCQAEDPHLTLTLLSFSPFLESLLSDPQWLSPLMSFLLKFRSSNSSVAAKIIDPLHQFLLHHYPVLCVRPDLFKQCLRNMPSTFTAVRIPLKPLDSAVPPSRLVKEEPQALLCGVKPPYPAPVLPPFGVKLADYVSAEPMSDAMLDEMSVDALSSSASSKPDSYVRWANQVQHGCSSRRLMWSPSPYEVKKMAVSPEFHQVAYTCEPFVVRVGGTSDFHHSTTHTLTHTTEVTSLEFASETTLMTGTASGDVLLWNLQTSEISFIGLFHTRRVTGLTVHPSDTVLCSSSLDTYCIVWDFTEKGLKSKLRQSLDDIVQKSPFTPDQVYFKPRFSKGLRPLVPLLVLRHHGFPVASVRFHSSMPVLASGAWDGTVVQYDLSNLHDTLNYNEKLYNLVPVTCHRLPSPVRVVHFVPSMVATCVAGLFDGRLAWLEQREGNTDPTECALISTLHRSPISALSFSPDGKLMASADTSGVIALSYTGLMGTLFTTFNGHSSNVTGVAFVEGLSSSLSLFTSGEDQTIQVWHVGSGEESRGPTAHSAAVTAVACSEDGRMFVTGGVGGMALVFTFDSKDLAEFFKVCRTSTEEPTQVTSQRGGKADYRFPSFVLPHDGKEVCAITFGTHETLLTGVVSGTVYVWATEPGLDRRTGRLLYTVEDPVYGCYPIVSLKVRSVGWGSCPLDRVEAVSSSGDRVSFDLMSDAVLSTAWKGKGSGEEDANSCAAQSQSVSDGKYRTVRSSFQWKDTSIISMLDDDASLRPSAELMSQEERALAFANGEELIGSVPIRFSERNQSVPEEEVELLVGRTKFFLTVKGCAWKVPFQVRYPTIDEEMVDWCFHAELGEDECFQCVSRHVIRGGNIYFAISTHVSVFLFTAIIPSSLSGLDQLAINGVCLSAEANAKDPLHIPRALSLDLCLLPTASHPSESSLLLLVGGEDCSSRLLELPGEEVLAVSSGEMPLIREIGTIFVASSVTTSIILTPFVCDSQTSSNSRVASHLLHSLGLLRPEELAEVEKAPLLQWVAGDALGNVYQMRIVDGQLFKHELHPGCSKPMKTLKEFAVPSIARLAGVGESDSYWSAPASTHSAAPGGFCLTPPSLTLRFNTSATTGLSALDSKLTDFSDDEWLGDVKFKA